MAAAKVHVSIHYASAKKNCPQKLSVFVFVGNSQVCVERVGMGILRLPEPWPADSTGEIHVPPRSHLPVGVLGTGFCVVAD